MKAFGPLLVGLLVGAVAGALIGALLLGDRPSPARSPSLVAPIAPARSPSAAAPIEAVPVEAQRVDAPTAGSSPSGVVDAVLEAVRASPRPTPRKGDGKLDGRIARPDGSGVEGVVVRAFLQFGEWGLGASRVGRGAPPLDTLDFAVKRAIDSWYDSASRYAETTTDGDGRYRFGELAGGRFSVETWLDGYAIEVVGALQPEATTGSTLDFLATPVETVAVEVTLPDGSAPARAALLLTQRNGTRSTESRHLWTPGAGELRLKPGTCELRATLGEPLLGPAWPQLMTSLPVELRVVAGVAADRVRLSLRASPGIRGRVTFPPGTQRLQGLVKISPAPASGEPDLAALAQRNANGDVQWLQRDEYLFQDRAPGRYVVGVSRGWNERILVHAVVDVGDSMVVCDLAVPPADPASSLVVKVLDPDGALVDAADFQWTIERAERGSWSGSGEAELKPNGNWWVAFSTLNEIDLAKPWPDDITVSLAVSTTRFGRKSVVVAKGTRALQVRFSAPATLHATIDGFAGSGYEGRLFLALSSAAEGARASFGNVQAVGADGSQKFGPVESGRYRLTLKVQGKQSWEQRDVANTDVDLAPGENHASIALPRLCDVVIEAPGSSGSIGLQGGAQGEFFYEALDAEGRATFHSLPPGDYVAQLHDGGAMQMMRLRLPTAGVVRFEAMVVNAMRVIVQRRDGTLATHGFEDGDLLVAVDGVELVSTQQLQIALMQAIAKKEVVFVVERGRARVELTLNPRELLDSKKLGGSFEPTTR